MEIRVDQLALHGLPPGQREAVREAIVRELGRIGGEGGVPSAGTAAEITSRVSQAVQAVQAVQRKPER